MPTPIRTSPIRVVQYGLGPIGQACIRTILEKQAGGHLLLVGAIDINPELVGKNVGTVADSSVPTDVIIEADADAVLGRVNADVVVHTTTSFLAKMHEQLSQCARHGCHVVSSTEELSYPFDRHPELSDTLDQVAQENGVTIVGTGVNPGYAMDTLALTATGVCQSVASVHIERVVDAGKRRGPLQRKVGAGITTDAFARKKATGEFGHIGLRESLLMVADGLGWELDEIRESLDPMIAPKAVKTPHAYVEAGRVAGIHHAITGSIKGETVLSLDLKMYVGAEDPKDAVRVVGDPPIDLIVRDGIFGDTATVAALINTIPLAMNATPGLRTAADLPVPRAFGTRARV